MCGQLKHARHADNFTEAMNQYRIFRRYDGRYFIKYRWLRFFWVTHEGDYGPVYFDTEWKAREVILTWERERTTSDKLVAEV